MKPWKITVDWICHDAYGSPVEVWLHVMGEEPRCIHEVTDAADLSGPAEVAIWWAQKWIEDRGFEPGIVQWPPKLGTSRVVLHPKPLERNENG